MMRQQIGGGIVLLLMALAFLLPAPLANASSDWPHVDLSAVSSSSDSDMAYRPDTNLIGMAVFDLQTKWVLGYWEYNRSTGALTGEDICGTTLPSTTFAGPPRAVGIDYVDENHVVIAFSYTDLVSIGGVDHQLNKLTVIEGTYDLLSAEWVWTRYEADSEIGHLFDPYGPYYSQAFGELDVACDKRSGHIGEYHVAYTDESRYQTQQGFADSDPELLVQAVYTQQGTHGSGPSGIRGIVDTVGPVVGVSGVTLRLSLKASSQLAPQLVFDDCRMMTDTEVINYTTWSDASQAWTAPRAILWGRFPGLALDPSSGNPRVALTFESGGVYFSGSDNAGATWSWYQAVYESNSMGLHIDFDIANDANGDPVMDVAWLHNAESVRVSKCVDGVWGSPETASADSLYSIRVLVDPDSATDPWVLCYFSGLGLGWNGEPEGCGTTPIRRGVCDGASGLKATLPLALALAAVAAWRFRNARRKKVGA